MTQTFKNIGSEFNMPKSPYDTYQFKVRIFVQAKCKVNTSTYRSTDYFIIIVKYYAMKNTPNCRFLKKNQRNSQV